MKISEAVEKALKEDKGTHENPYKSMDLKYIPPILVNVAM